MAEDKPVVESFQLDHTKVKAPYVRYIDTETGPHGDVISNYDLRLVQPNENAIPTGGLHTIEHTIAVLLIPCTATEHHQDSDTGHLT